MPDLNGNLRNILSRESKFPSCSDPLFIFSLSLGLISVNISLARAKLLKLTQVFTIFKVINMARFRKKISFFWAQNIFLLTWNTFPCNINKLLSTPDYFSCNVKRLFSTRNCFWCNTKLLLWTSFRMLYHSDIFLLSRGNKNVITC